MDRATTERDRARGAVLGQAWGDALGCPVEGWHADEIARHFGDYATLPAAYPDSVGELDARRQRRLRPLGLYSDDTQQALALLGVILDEAGWSPEAWAAWLIAGDEANAWRGTGRNFAAAVAALSRDTPPQSSGSSSAGIGAAMRAGPAGAALRRQPEHLSRVIAEASLTTHRDLRAAAVAYAVADAVSGLVRGDAPEAVRAALPGRVAGFEAVWAGATNWAVHLDGAHAVSQALTDLCAGPADDLATLGARVTALARPWLERPARAHPNQGFAPLGGLHGLLAGLTSDADPAARLTAVIRQGGDTDTVGAIAGTVLGTRFGASWVAIDRLVDATRLQAWADAAAEAGPAPEDRVAFLNREAALTAWENEFQRSLA